MSAWFSSTPVPTFASRPCATELTRVDAVLYTHAHADHILGLDDLRPLSFTVFREGGHIPLYASPDTEETLRRIYDYTFSPKATYPNRARVHLQPLADRENVLGVEFIRVPVSTGIWRSMASASAAPPTSPT